MPLQSADIAAASANNSGDFIVWIGQLDSNGDPVADGEEFAKTTISDATLPTDGLVLVTAKFATTPVDVTQGTTYGLFVTRDTAFEVGTHNEDKCPGKFYCYPITEIEFAEIEDVDMLFTASVA